MFLISWAIGIQSVAVLDMDKSPWATLSAFLFSYKLIL